MSLIYLQYHNCEQQDSLPHGIGEDISRLQIFTRQSSAMKASGRVMLIAGLGRPRQYYLWSTFTIDCCQRKPDGQILLGGPGWSLVPPQQLHGAAFNQFKAACANFIGFRNISDLPFTRQLLLLADRFQPAGPSVIQSQCLRTLASAASSSSVRKQLAERLACHEARISEEMNAPTIALSIRQPHVEAIFRGIKKIEYRRDATTRRGRILIYSAKLFADNLPHWIKTYGFEKMNIDELPRGVVVGSVELYQCEGGQWYLRHPLRATTFRQPTGRPQPIWFTPFP